MCEGYRTGTRRESARDKEIETRREIRNQRTSALEWNWRTRYGFIADVRRGQEVAGYVLALC